MPASEKPQVKIPSKLKEALHEAKAAMEKRLREEQKIVSLIAALQLKQFTFYAYTTFKLWNIVLQYHQQKRLSKAQAFHMSDEEKKKRRQSKKVHMLIFIFNGIYNVYIIGRQILKMHRSWSKKVRVVQGFLFYNYYFFFIF